jgi:carbon storage regulator CsrA
MGNQPVELTRIPRGVDRSYSRRGLHTPPALTTWRLQQMLVLKRNVNEEIVITVNGYMVTVVVAEARNGAVKLGFVAPPSVIVDRREVWERKQRIAVTK